MRIQGINRNDPERVDVSVENVQGATITLGYPVCFTTTANSNDGVKAVLPAATALKTFAGIALRNVSNTDSGLVRAYGYTASIAIFATGSSVTVAAGEVMGVGAGSLGVNSTGLTFAYGPVVAMEAIGAAVNSPGGYAKGFVRAL